MRIRVKLYICDRAGSAKLTRLLYDGDSEEMAHLSYESACTVVDHASKHKPLRVVYLTNDGAVKSHGYDASK